MTPQQRANEMLLGWLAADRGEPHDRARPQVWREGFLLRQQTRIRRPS